jgi:serine/threonine-protein kinase ULK/ATG1
MNTGLPQSPLAQSPPQSPRRRPRTLGAERSFIPGETEEDGLLRKEYVLVEDTRAVDVHRTVDGKQRLDRSWTLTSNTSIEIHAARKRPLQSRRQTSISSPVVEAPSAEESPTGTMNGVAIPQTFPPPPNPNNYPGMSSSPTSAASRAASNALARALSLASKRLFGPTATSRPSPPMPARDIPPSPRRQPLTALRGDEADPVEDALLAELEERAQKTEVLTHWGDELFEFVKAIPQSECL